MPQPRANIVTGPLAQAVSRFSAKTPIGSMLKSEDWKLVPLALRERAFFSATVTHADFLQEAQSGILELVSVARRKLADGSEGAFQTREKLVADMMDAVKRYGIGQTDPAKQGGLEDIGSVRRLNLIVDFNRTQSNEFARWKTEQDPAILDAFPAQEFVRIEPRDDERTDWPDRWAAAGGTLYEGRMIALKNDPVWAKLSRFETPFPPFDFGSGMGLEDIGRDEAEELGVIKPEERVQPGDVGFNDTLSASVENLSPRTQSALQTIFGDQVNVAEGRAEWRKAA